MSETARLFIPGAPGAAPLPPVRRTERPPNPLTPHTPVPAPAAPETVAAVPRQRAVVEDGADVGLLDRLLHWIVKMDGSDLHLASGEVPRARLHGRLQPIDGTDAIPAAALEQMLAATMNERQAEKFAATNDIDLAYPLGNTARFRVNVMRKRGSVGAVMRLIPTRVKSVTELAVPEPLQRLAQLPRGLVLVTGPTGSGKSTLLAALVDLANRTRTGHIVTIEDPIEFTHQSQSCVVSQRQVGEDTESFSSGLRAAMRQDPDIILLGEMRDFETVGAALEAANTGHLVFGTLHTNSAPESISRIVDMFPSGQQNAIRSSLSLSLEAVITQTLVRTPDGAGRVAAREVMMLGTDSRNLIRQGKLEQMPSVLQTGAERGMYTLNADLARLVSTKQITYEDAAAVASNVNELRQKLQMPALTLGGAL